MRWLGLLQAYKEYLPVTLETPVLQLPNDVKSVADYISGDVKQ